MAEIVSQQEGLHLSDLQKITQMSRRHSIRMQHGFKFWNHHQDVAWITWMPCEDNAQTADNNAELSIGYWSIECNQHVQKAMAAVTSRQLQKSLLDLYEELEHEPRHYCADNVLLSTNIEVSDGIFCHPVPPSSSVGLREADHNWRDAERDQVANVWYKTAAGREGRRRLTG